MESRRSKRDTEGVGVMHSSGRPDIQKQTGNQGPTPAMYSDKYPRNHEADMVKDIVKDDYSSEGD